MVETSEFPQIVRTTWRDSAGTNWLVEVTFSPVAGRLECVGVGVRSFLGDANLSDVPVEPAAVLSAVVLRQVPIGRIVAELRENMTRSHHPDTVVLLDDDEPEPPQDEEHRLHALWARSPRGGPRLREEHYREVAQVYVTAWQRGRAPTKAVARKFQITHSGAAKQVQKARALGFLLPAAGPGRAGVREEEETP